MTVRSVSHAWTDVVEVDRMLRCTLQWGYSIWWLLLGHALFVVAVLHICAIATVRARLVVMVHVSCDQCGLSCNTCM